MKTKFIHYHPWSKSQKVLSINLIHISLTALPLIIREFLVYGTGHLAPSGCSCPDYPLFGGISGKLELSGSLNDKHTFWLLTLKFISGSRWKLMLGRGLSGRYRKPQGHRRYYFVCPDRKSGASLSKRALSQANTRLELCLALIK